MNNRLKKIRKSLNLTQKKIAEALGKTVTMYQYYESGDRSITDGVLLRLSEIFNVNINWLRTGEGAMFNDSTMSKRFKELRDALNLTQEEMAKRLGVEYLTIIFYEDGERNIDIKLALELKKLFNINVNWLITGEGSMFNRDIATFDTDESDIITIPYYSKVSASAGSGELVYDETTVRQIKISSSIINISHGNNICLINATGSSMEPVIDDGDLLMVDLNSKEYLDEGIYVVRLENSLLVKRLQKIPYGTCLISENPKYRTIEISANNFNESDVSIVGKVLSVIKNFTGSMM